MTEFRLYSVLFYLDEYDSNDILCVACMVNRLNPHQRGNDPEDIARNMLWIAENNISAKPGYVGTGGWQMTSYVRHDGKMGIKASVSSCLFAEVMKLPA